MNGKKVLRRIVVLLLALNLSLPLLPAAAQDNNHNHLIIEPGAPSVWSMGQAHYLLTQMHQVNRELKTHMPDEGALDPNGVNASRIRLLKTLFDIQAEFDQKLGVENRTRLREHERKLQDREIARLQLTQIEAELTALDQELLAAKRRRDELEVDLQQKQELFNGRSRPSRTLDSASSAVPPTQDELRALERELALLKKEIALKQERHDALAAEKTALTTKATEDLSAISGLQTTATGSPTGNGASLPSFESSLQTFLTKAFEGVGRPRLAASIALDNFIGMQYEIISKQLTLLRDEVGPDRRIVFLELPVSIYTPDKKGDGYLAQARWEVTHYAEATKEEEAISFGRTAGGDDDNAAPRPTPTPKTSPTPTPTPTPRPADYLKQAKINISQTQIVDLQATPMPTPTNAPPFDCNPCRDLIRRSLYQGNVQKLSAGEAQELEKRVNDLLLKRRDLMAEGSLCWQKADTDLVHAIDVIPRQSSLNVNEAQAVATQWNFLGLLKVLSGFGLRVNYQRQEQTFEAFLQQEVFAAGFGKGDKKFGWTFGPLPGSKRIAPGVRTMYAVLVVPRATKQLKIRATGLAYRRDKAPDEDDKSQVVFRADRLYDPEAGGCNDFFKKWAEDQKSKEKNKQSGAGESANDERQARAGVREGDGWVAAQPVFNVLIPSEVTTSWRVEEMQYIAAGPSEPVTAIVQGNAFSGQTSVLIDGVPLQRVVSLGNSAASDAQAEPTTAGGVHGQFEVVNARQITMKFAMGRPDYVGTPNITIVAPERSSVINFFSLDELNGRHNRNLYNFSLHEPMFIGAFNLEKKLHVIGEKTVGGETFVMAKLKGAGLRRDADVWIGNSLIEYEQECETRGLDHCLNRFRDRSFITQTDTKEYFLYFPKPTAVKWPIRYRQKTVRGFEAEEFEHDSGPPPNKDGQVEVVSYTPRRDRAQVELRLYGKQPDRNITLPDGSQLPEGVRLLPDGIGTLQGHLYPESNSSKQESWRALFNVTYENLGDGPVEREVLSVQVGRRDDKGAVVLRTTQVPLPLRPRLARLELLRQSVGGEPNSQVLIEGVNLQNVTEVFVAGRKATIIGQPSSTALVVELPGGAFIKEERGVKIPVVLKTAQGDSITGVVTLTGPSTGTVSR